MSLQKFENSKIEFHNSNKILIYLFLAIHLFLIHFILKWEGFRMFLKKMLRILVIFRRKRRNDAGRTIRIIWKKSNSNRNYCVKKASKYFWILSGIQQLFVSETFKLSRKDMQMGCNLSATTHRRNDKLSSLNNEKKFT